MDKIISFIDEGDFKNAIERLRLLESTIPINNDFHINKIGLLIEIGDGTKNNRYIFEAITHGKTKLKESISKNINANVCLYVGNAYMALFDRQEKVDYKILIDNPNLKNAKYYYRKGLDSCDKNNKMLYKRILTNYGNCMDYLGRSIEALYIYDAVLKIDNNFSMAIGNKAIAMSDFADITGEYRGGIYIKSYQMLQQAISDPTLINLGGTYAKESFINKMKQIESLFKNKELLSKNIEHKNYDSGALSKFEKYYVDFCIRHGLFLNLHLPDEKCESAIVDPISISMVTPIHDPSKYFTLVKHINNIKEDYTTSRFIFVLSQYNTNVINQINKRTSYPRTYDYAIFNIYCGLLKTAFIKVYSILDKISRFINDYYDLKIQKNIYFGSIWKIKNEKGEKVVRPEIINSQNKNLYAIYDISNDFKLDMYKRIEDIRNATTHEKLIIYDSILAKDVPYDKNNISDSELISETIILFQLIKSIIMYLINGVTYEERKKAKDLGDKIGDIGLY